MSVLVEYTVKILVRQDEAPDTQTATFEDIGEIGVYKGTEYIQHETTEVEVLDTDWEASVPSKE